MNAKDEAMALLVAGLRRQAAQADLLPVWQDEAEDPRVIDLLRETITRCHVTQEVKWLGDNLVWPYDLASGPGPDEFPGLRVITNPMVSIFIPKDALAAIMAHELGHISSGDIFFKQKYIERLQSEGKYDPKNFEWEDLPQAEIDKLKPLFHAQEFKADQFAKDHGYGDVLADYLEGRLSAERDDINPEASLAHPSPASRIARLRSKEAVAA